MEVAGGKTTLLTTDFVRKTPIYKAHREQHPVTAAVASRGKSRGRRKRTAKTTTKREQPTTQTGGVHNDRYIAVCTPHNKLR